MISYPTGNGEAHLFGRTNVANYMGLDPSSDKLEAFGTANPEEELYLHVFAFALNPSLDPNVIDVGVTIDYDSKWRQKKLLTQS